MANFSVTRKNTSSAPTFFFSEFGAVKRFSGPRLSLDETRRAEQLVDYLTSTPNAEAAESFDLRAERA